jgi:hypothetical protein
MKYHANLVAVGISLRLPLLDAQMFLFNKFLKIVNGTINRYSQQLPCSTVLVKKLIVARVSKSPAFSLPCSQELPQAHILSQLNAVFTVNQLR